MDCIELFNSDFTTDLIGEISSIDLSQFSNKDLFDLETKVRYIQDVADQRTLDEEIVGYTYSNLGLLTPKISNEMVKRKIKI